MLSVKLPKVKSRILFSTLALILAACAQKSGGSAEDSKEHYRLGMEALTNGDEETAERELKSSLSYDSNNSRARTALASLYASQSGINLFNLMDSFIEGADRLETRLKDIQRMNDLRSYLAGYADTLMRANATMPDDAVSAQEIADRLKYILEPIQQVSAISNIFLDVFHSVPGMNAQQLARLDLSIATIRNDSLDPKMRNEEHRLYLALLATVRLINHSRNLIVGSVMEGLEGNRSRLCNVDRSVLTESVKQIRISLGHLEEGLVTGPNEEMSRQREARLRVRKSIASILNHDAWNHLDTILDNKSPIGRSAQLLYNGYCAGDSAEGIMKNLKSLWKELRGVSFGI